MLIFLRQWFLSWRRPWPPHWIHSADFAIKCQQYQQVRNAYNGILIEVCSAIQGASKFRQKDQNIWHRHSQVPIDITRTRAWLAATVILIHLGDWNCKPQPLCNQHRMLLKYWHRRLNHSRVVAVAVTKTRNNFRPRQIIKVQRQPIRIGLFLRYQITPRRPI